MSVSTILTSKRTISAIVCSLSLAAMAATPVAVWDGDFSPGELTKFSGYELVDWQMTHGGVSHESGATDVDYSSVTIDRNNQGLMFNASSAMPGVTVLVKYSNLESSSSNGRVLAASCVTSSHQYDRTGITLKSDGTLVGLWNSSTTANSDTDNGTASGSIARSGVMAFTYSTAGTYLYYGESCADISTTAAWGSSGLKAAADTAIYGAAIGGMNADASRNGYEAAKGMTIEALAVFDRVLTVAEMNAYIWPSEVQTIPVTDSITVSAINSQIDANTYKTVKVVAEDGATIAVDAAFSTALPIAVSSTGSITLSATSQPAASFFTGVDFSGVKGGVLRSWLATPGVVGFNFNSANGTDTSAALVAGTWQANASDASGTADLFGDGLSVLAWGSSLYSRGSSTFLDGYIDDAWSGNGATITLSNVPYETYDVVIYASTDSGSVFTAKTVNGTAYTWNAVQSAAVQGAGTWGSVGVTSAIYGVNSLRIKNLSGPLTIYGGSRTNPARGGIAAIQIMPTDAPDVVKTYTLTLDGTATSWSTGTWTLDGATVSAPTAGNVVINATASTTLTIDADVTLGDVTVNGGENIVVTLALGEKTAASGDTAATYYSFYAGKVAIESGVLQQGSSAVLGTTPAVAVADGATFDLNGLAPNAATIFYLAGDGAGNWPYALTSSANMTSGYVKEIDLAADATIGGDYMINYGQSGAGNAFVLNEHTLTKDGSGELKCYNGRPRNGTVDIAGGTWSCNEWTNFGGFENIEAEIDVYLRSGATLKNNGRWNWIGTLHWLGGTLNTASSAFGISKEIAGSGTTAGIKLYDGAKATLTGDMTLTGSLLLGGNGTDSGNVSIVKDQNTQGPVTFTVGACASSGTITVGAGVVFNLGTVRPAASFTVDDEGTLVVQKSSATDVPVLNVSAEPANVVFKDENGTEIESPKLVYDSEAGTLTFYAGNVWTAADGTAFDTPANWSIGVAPSSGESATLQILGDTEITVAGTYTLDALVIYGAGEVTFTGAGSVTAANIYLENGATLKRDDATISATTGISLASGTVLKLLDGVTEAAVISGAGAVETYGNVVLAAGNTLTGGITVKSGSRLSTNFTPVWDNPSTKTDATTGYGRYNKNWAATSQRVVTVEDGGCVDINNVANKDCAVALCIAGKGILSDGVYSGSVVYTGSSAIGNNARQISNLSLTADALVDLGAGWGLVHSGHENACLALNGHTLTLRGSTTTPMVKVNVGSGTTGTLLLDGASLMLSDEASNLTNVNIVAKGCATINLAAAPSAIGSLTLKPSASGTTATAWNLPANFVPALNTSNIDPSGLSVGDTLTLFTAPSGTELTSETITVNAGSRYETTISGNTVTATVKAGTPVNFIHYDFADGTGQAADTTYTHGTYNGATRKSTRNGKAMLVNSSNTPYHSSNSLGKSPFYTGEMTVTALVKAGEADNTILWNLGQASVGGIALLARNSTTFTLVSWDGDVNGSDVVSVTGVDVIGKWHLVTVVANASGTTLYVDNVSATVDAVLPSSINQCGQFGSIHGNKKNYNFVTSVGYLLDDWRVYDAALTAKEIKALKRELNPDPLFIRLR